MANKSVFAATKGRLSPAVDTVNRAGGPAYAYAAPQKLAQLAMTGTFNDTFYASATSQIDDVLAACAGVDADFIAKTAVYARQYGHMKDAPALLVAVLSTFEGNAFERAFARVVDNGRMVRTFVQIMRSGAVGRKSLGTRPKRAVQNWLNAASDHQLINAAVGQSPSLADVVKMVHPKPASREREAFFAWLIGKPHDVSALPQALQDFARFKATGGGETPGVPFQMLTALDLDARQWAQIANNGGWQMVRMNLNTFARHGVFTIRGMDRAIAAKLADADVIKRARALPYQLMVAERMAEDGVPRSVRRALEAAMEIAVANTPRVAGDIVVCPDVSGSMAMPVTGYRRGSSSAVRCVDVAALVAAAFLRTNRQTRVMPFDTQVREVRLRSRDSVFTNAGVLARQGGGGTNCSAPLAQLNAEGAAPDLVVFVSDNESWADPRYGRGTAMMREWEQLKAANPNARMVCIDIAPYGTCQAPDRDDVMNVGGFSDAVFDAVAAFARGERGAEHWVRQIETMEV